MITQLPALLPDLNHIFERMVTGWMYQKNGCPFASFFRPFLKKKGRHSSHWWLVIQWQMTGIASVLRCLFYGIFGQAVQIWAASFKHSWLNDLSDRSPAFWLWSEDWVYVLDKKGAVWVNHICSLNVFEEVLSWCLAAFFKSQVSPCPYFTFPPQTLGGRFFQT